MCDSDEEDLIESFSKLSKEKSLKNINHMDDASIRRLAGLNLYEAPEEFNMNHQESFLVHRISELKEKSRQIVPIVLNNLLIGMEILDNDVNNIKYNLCLQTMDESKNTYNIAKSFEDFYGFYLELVLKLSQFNIDSKLTIFPRRYKRANFGFIIPDDELLIRCEQLNSWVGSLLTAYKSYPETIQDNIQFFFNLHVSDSRLSNIDIYKSQKKCKLFFDSYIISGNNSSPGTTNAFINSLDNSSSIDISSCFRDSIDKSINLIQWESKKEGLFDNDSNQVSSINSGFTASSNSDEFEYTYTKLMDWMSLNDLNLNNKHLSEVIELKYVQYISVCDKTFSRFDTITVKLFLPISADTVSSVGVEIKFCLNDLVSNIFVASLQKFKTLGVGMHDSLLDCYVIKVVGEKNYLLYKNLPIYMYECARKVFIEKSVLNLTICTMDIMEKDVMLPLINRPLEEITTLYDKKFKFHQLKIPEFILPVNDLIDLDKNSLLPKELPYIEKEKMADTCLNISVDSIILNEKAIVFFKSLKIVVNLSFNGEIICPPFECEPIGDLKSRTMKTGLLISTIPPTTRVSIVLQGIQNIKGKETRFSIGGASITLFNYEHKMSHKSMKLGLWGIRGKRPWEELITDELIDTSRLTRISHQSMPSNIEKPIIDLITSTFSTSSSEKTPSKSSLFTEEVGEAKEKLTDEHGNEIQENSVREHDLLTYINGCDIHSKMSVSITFRFSSLVIKKATTVYTPPLIKGYIDSKRQSIMSSKLNESVNVEIPSVHHAKLIEVIEKLDSLQELTEVQKGMMWIYRSVDWIKDPKKTEESRNLMVSWEPVTYTIDLIELLDIRYSDPIVREWAISNNLDKLNDEDLNEILLQLVQVLKYEAYHDSAIARFLLYRSILSPHTIGHTFYWLLKSEMHNPLIRDRFGVLLMVYLKNCGLHCTTLQQQCELNDSLTAVTDSLKGQSKKIREQYVKEQLEILNSKLPSTFSLCLNPKIECKSIRVEKCRVMDSKKLPLWLVLVNSDPISSDLYILFKSGDDLRQDQLTLQIIRVMDSLWREGYQGVDIAPIVVKKSILSFFSSKKETENESTSITHGQQDLPWNTLELSMKGYGAIATGNEKGIIEVVLNSDTIANIQTKYAGKISGAFSLEPIVDFLKENNPNNYEQAAEVFCKTCAGYCVATYVLGIGDRHADNIMITKSGHLFHIDFGHFLGNFKEKFNIKRERDKFVFTPEMANVLKASPNLFAKFENICCNAYNILRRRCQFIISLFSLMIPAEIPELMQRSDICYLTEMLALDLTDEEAKVKFLQEIQNSLNTTSRRIDNWFHNIKHKI